MKGRILGILIVGSAAIAGIGVWYLQVHAYYNYVASPRMELTSAATGLTVRIPADGANAIDARSSPLRYRACFTTTQSQAALATAHVAYEGAVPLNAPGWFDCFNAAAIGSALESGEAIALLGLAGIHEGVDRVVAVFDDGRAFSWHQLSKEHRN